jgi:predicted nucleic acid-binding protein
LKPDEAVTAAEDLVKIFAGLKIETTSDLAADALNISSTRNLAVYDSLYVAASKKLGGTLYTADQKLHEVACKIANSILLKPTQSSR